MQKLIDLLVQNSKNKKNEIFDVKLTKSFDNEFVPFYAAHKELMF